jgi:hypothetical protein
MKFDQIKKIIEDTGSGPGKTRLAITRDNSYSFYGCFDVYNISLELKEQNKWRFVPLNNIPKYLDELKQLRFPGPEHSIIIDGDSISNIEVVKDYWGL